MRIDQDEILRAVGRRLATVNPETRKLFETTLQLQMASLSTGALLLQQWGKTVARCGAAASTQGAQTDGAEQRLERALGAQRHLVVHVANLPKTAGLTFLSELAKLRSRKADGGGGIHRSKDWEQPLPTKLSH